MRENNSAKRSLVVLAWSYSACNALSSAATMAYSIDDFFGPPPVYTAVASSITAIVGFAIAFYLQGKSITEEPEHRASLLINSSDKNVRDLHHEQQQKAQRHRRIRSALAQLFYLLLDLSNSAADRYFFVGSLIENNHYFYPTFASSFVLKYLFMLSNETYQPCQAIAAKITANKHALPVYSDCLKKLYRVRKLFSLVGSVDHTVFEDLTPLMITLLQFRLISSSMMKQTEFLSASIPVAVLLFLLVLTQTYLYEGKKAQENIKQCAEKKEIEPSRSYLTICCLKTINCLLPWVMLPLHAINNAVPVYVVGKSWIKNDTFGLPLTYTLTAVVALITMLGIYHSEIKEARQELDDMARNQEDNGVQMQERNLPPQYAELDAQESDGEEVVVQDEEQRGETTINVDLNGRVEPNDDDKTPEDVFSPKAGAPKFSHATLRL